MPWDKEMTARLVSMGLTWDKAREVVGVIAEERQIADREGYIRGFNNGHTDAIKTLLKKSPAF